MWCAVVLNQAVARGLIALSYTCGSIVLGSV